MTTERLLQVLNVMRADWPAHSEFARDYQEGFNAALTLIEKAVRLEDAVMAGMPAVERVAAFADDVMEAARG
jgi:hypothetical protein